MDPQIVEWLNLLVKWIHLIVGIAWIGASFYFNWLEGNLQRNHSALANGVAGDLWAIHGGGFYHVQKFENTPEKLPQTLHWFKWEAYLTGITGFIMMTLVFYITPSLTLLQPTSSLSHSTAIAISILSMLGSWLFYHLLCKSTLGNQPKAILAIMVVYLFIVALGLNEVFTDKATYLHIGAIIGIIMVLNVFFMIIPSQRKMVKSMQQGRTPDPLFGKEGFQRSFHNNYFTLPVLFIMISGHYPMTYGHEHGLWILLAISLIGVLVRHYFNLKNKGVKHHWILPTAALLMSLLAYLSFPKPIELNENVADSTVTSIMQTHCITCHAEQPSFQGFNSPPLGLVLETKQQWIDNFSKIFSQTVHTHAMPPGNLSQMTELERQQLGQWLTQKIDQN
ncbi:urate hydroxylase PuuD [Thiomicrorhabdus indica]|uniref:urate hydroxylase PuuD n=1 Tax=Thiomicrorhabdus indica TaxID=2267253 RepID=UPI002AA94B4E|nr:urate hydroxylase PuuD [Thiomicrorhabdus indica]